MERTEVMNRPSIQQVALAALVAVAVLGFLFATVRAGSASISSNDYETDQVVVKLDLAAGVTITDINTTYGTTVLDLLLQSAGIYLLQVPPGVDAAKLANRMSKDLRLLYAEPNFIGEAPEADPSHTYAWGGPDPQPFFNQYAIEVLNLQWAHDISRGDGVVVAVLDTGVELNHPGLAASLTITRYDFVDDDPVPQDEFNGLDDDGDGLVDEAAGHGTHVAGIVHLVAPAARIMPLRVLDSEGRGNVFVIAEAILFAARNGARIINLSLGTSWPSELLEEVIEDVTKEGVLVVAAAGNLNSTLEQYPAAFDEEELVLAVTSVDPLGRKSSFANYGRWIDVTAPGESIYSTFPPDGYAWWSGTSMAAPFVAGQAALTHSVAPSLPMSQVVALITNTARPLDAQNPAFAGLLGAGEVDVGGSLGCHWADLWPDAEHDLLNNHCDGVIDVRDVMAVTAVLNATGPAAGTYDVNQDGIVDVQDVQRVTSRWRARQRALSSTP